MKIGVFGWGVVAPKSPTIEAFKANLESSQTWLTPFEDYGPNNFLVGIPQFSLNDYKDWITSRFPSSQVIQLEQKMDPISLYAVGAFIQSLGQNPGIESVLRELGIRAHVYIGTSLGSIPSSYHTSVAIHKAQLRWDKFWAQPQRNTCFKKYLTSLNGDETPPSNIPPDPKSAGDGNRDEAEEHWNHFWAAQSPELRMYLQELAHAENQEVYPDSSKTKRSSAVEKERLYSRLKDKWGAPDPPWKLGAAGFWNLPSTPSAQVSILGKITGLSFAPAAACSSFGVALRVAVTAIQSEQAKAVVIGAVDPPPHRYTVGAFYNARVASCSGSLSLPLSSLQGTHIAGGAAVWVIADYDYMKSKGFRPLGMEIVGVGVSSDADHLITPSRIGPQAAILDALQQAHLDPADIRSWDLHATGTPGDHAEVSTFSALFPETVLLSARKGTFGHGLGVSGGWELTAQYLGCECGKLFPTLLTEQTLNASIAELHQRFVYNEPCSFPYGPVGKLSMGLGGINVCVISRPWS